MSHQRDYILRLIEQMGGVLAELRRRILGQGADPAEVDLELSSVADRAGLDLALLRGFSPDTLHMFVSPSGEVEPARCWLMAELLYLDALQAGLEGRADAERQGLEKARLLFSLIEPAGGMLVGLAEAGQRVEEIDRRLSEGVGTEPA